MEEIENQRDGRGRGLVAAKEQSQQEVTELLGIKVRLLQNEPEKIRFTDTVCSLFLLMKPFLHQSLDHLQDCGSRLHRTKEKTYYSNPTETGGLVALHLHISRVKT